MYQTLLAIHSVFRWLVLLSLIVAIYRAFRAYLSARIFSALDNAVRHWTATISHLQLVFGILLYFASPVIDYFLHNYSQAVHQREVRFFGMEHNIMMLLAITLITIGSAKAKRKVADRQKHKTILVWYGIALLLIFLSIPWPFSPLAARPYIRGF